MIKTTSLELSKQLKEAGYPQESSFWYLLGDWEESKVGLPAYIEELGGDWFTDKWRELRIAAPTAEEILELLPAVFYTKKISWQLKAWKSEGGYWLVDYAPSEEEFEYGKSGNFIQKLQQKGSLSEAAGKMYIYLKKEGLL